MRDQSACGSIVAAEMHELELTTITYYDEGIAAALDLY